jgi:hypothetical protein
MRDQTQTHAWRSLRRSALIGILVVLAGLVPTIARAQYNAPRLSEQAIGERYHVELSGTLWNPTLTGVVSSEQFGIPGSSLDFTTDLGFQQTRFKDLRMVLRPAKKHRFRFQNTPIEYTATSTLHRTITYNGISFPASLPVSSEFSWKVWRFGYEYDFAYMKRGFVGVLLEGRYTQFTSSLQSTSPLLVASEFTTAKAPLPAIGVVGRGYVAPNVAINFEVSGFKVPESLKDTAKAQANYYDWDINSTINLTNNAGVQVGWRRMTTFINVDRDMGDFKFQGLWFGAVARF